jgi:predicted small lipoprotein YifL
MIRPAILALAALAVIAALASCGKQADLERPQPHLSPRERAAVAAQQRDEAETATNATEANKAIPPQNPALTPYTNPGSMQTTPIPGERTNPSGSPNPNPQ